MTDVRREVIYWRHSGLRLLFSSEHRLAHERPSVFLGGPSSEQISGKQNMATRLTNVVCFGIALASALLFCLVRADEDDPVVFREYGSCDSRPNPGVMASMYLKGCGNRPVCPLYRGSNADMQIKFTSPNNTNGLYRSMFGVFRKVPVRYGRETNVCATTASQDGSKCSVTNGLRQGVTYTHSGTFVVKKYFPKVNVSVEIYLYDKQPSQMPVACVRIPVQILDTV